MPITVPARPTMNAAERDAVALRHAILLEHASQRSWRPLIIAVTVVAYCLFSWWMFNVGDTLRRANWGIAGTYLADWVSYEVRPEFDIARDGAMTLSYPRFSPLGDHPNPDWLTVEKTTMTRTVAAPVSGGAASTTAKPSMGFMGAGASLGNKAAAAEAAPQTVTDEVVTRAEVRYNGSTRIEITPDIVTADHAGETLTMRLNHETGTVEAEGALPEWATQKRPGEKITLAFGPTGWAEVAGNDVSIRNRFFGWANFLFDTQSPFFDKSAAEVFTLITSPRASIPRNRTCRLPGTTSSTIPNGSISTSGPSCCRPSSWPSSARCLPRSSPSRSASWQPATSPAAASPIRRPSASSTSCARWTC